MAFLKDQLRSVREAPTKRDHRVTRRVLTLQLTCVITEVFLKDGVFHVIDLTWFWYSSISLLVLLKKKHLLKVNNPKWTKRLWSMMPSYQVIMHSSWTTWLLFLSVRRCRTAEEEENQGGGSIPDWQLTIELIIDDEDFYRYQSRRISAASSCKRLP